MTTATPSTIARACAAAMWPDVQKQRKLCQGAYAFTCAGHGGIIGLVDELNLSAEVVEVARASGLIHLAARINLGSRHQFCLSAAGYRTDHLRERKERYPHAVELYDVWVAEEDCDWATLAFVSDDVRTGMSRSGYSTEITRDDALQCCQRWNQGYLTALGHPVETETAA